MKVTNFFAKVLENASMDRFDGKKSWKRAYRNTCTVLYQSCWFANYLWLLLERPNRNIVDSLKNCRFQTRISFHKRWLLGNWWRICKENQSVWLLRWEYLWSLNNSILTSLIFRLFFWWKISLIILRFFFLSFCIDTRFSDQPGILPK